MTTLRPVEVHDRAFSALKELRSALGEMHVDEVDRRYNGRDVCRELLDSTSRWVVQHEALSAHLREAGVPFCAGRSYVAHARIQMRMTNDGGWECPTCGEREAA